MLGTILVKLRRGLATPAPWLPTPAQQKQWAPPAPPPRAPSLRHPCLAFTLPHLCRSRHVSSSSFPLSPVPSSAQPPQPHHNIEYGTKSELRSGNRSAPTEAQVRLAPESLIQQRGPCISAILCLFFLSTSKTDSAWAVGKASWAAGGRWGGSPT